MKLNRVKKVILSFAVIVGIILGLGQNIIYATAGSLTAKLEVFRRLPKYDSSTKLYTQESTNWGFELYNGGHPVYQISEVDSSNNFIGDNARLYCLNATEGTTWDTSAVGTNLNYDTKCDLKNATEVNTTVGYNTVYDISKYDYYSSIIWLLDNFYIPNKTDKDDFLAKAGIIYGTLEDSVGSYNTYYYDESVNPNSVFSDSEEENSIYAQLYGNPYGKGGYGYRDAGKSNEYQVKALPDEVIETVQQAVIWYFTNHLDNNNDNTNTFNCYTDKNAESINSWLYYTIDGNNYNSLNNYQIDGNDGDSDGKVNIGGMYQEQAAILYNYLVDKALDAKEKGYTGEETSSSISIKCETSAIKKQTDGTYKIGPIEIETTGTVSEISLEVKDSEENDITCTIPVSIPVDQEFYIENIPSTIEGNITIKATAKGNNTTQTLWTKTGSTEQPIVEIDRGETPIGDTVTIKNEKVFDLALRKIITKVKNSNGTVVAILNEKGLDATRSITANPSTIPDTATYKHRKDPVVVGTGYKVTYELNIYNEGDIDGYASIIVDQLPTGLESTLKVGDKVTSSKGNVYEVKSYTDNKLVLELTSTTPVVIDAYNTTLDKDTIKLECEVTQVEDKSKHYLTNIAYINEAYSVQNGTAKKQDQDRNNKESKPAEFPSKTASDLNNTEVTYKGNSANQSIYNDTNNEYYYKGEQDDDDFETIVILPKEFDLKLVKYISAVNGNVSDRKITVDSSNLNKKINNKKVTTADYDVSKLPITVKTGDYVTYTFRIYNEGEIDGYASEITEDIPVGLEFVYSTLTTDAQIDADTNLSKEEKEAIKFNRNYGWTFTDNTLKTISTNFLSNVSTDNLIKAFDSSKDNGNGEGLSYKEVSVMFKVTSTDVTKIIRNEAAITEDTDADGSPINDRDSDTEKWKKEDSDDYYDNQDYPKYKEDDEDYDNIKLIRFDLALRKFIVAISADSTINDGEYLTADKTNKTVYTRAPKVDTSKLKTGEDLTAIYNHSKDPVTVNAGDYVLYTIRVYNEGDLDGYASKITDYLPENLNYIDGEFNKGYGWQYNSTDRSVTTTYLSSENGTANKLEAFDTKSDNGKGSGLSYKDIQILCRVSSDAVSEQNITNIAEITQYQDENGAVNDNDMDSDPSNLKYPENVPGYEGNRDGDNASDTYYPGQEDDDDFDRVIVQEPKFDLALRKFITKINNADITTRIPEVGYEDEKITYTHPKDVVKVVVGDTVTYTIRVYNEGIISGYAETVTDDIPEYLEYLPENATNVAYRWKMYDKDGNETEDVTKAEKIVTDYTSKEYGEKMMQDGENIAENPNLLNAFDSSAEISDTNPEYVDVKVAFKVKDPDSSKYIIKNKAQISEDCDENGNPVVDIDSVPNKWNDGEDDQDYENVSVEYFDLSLLKYVSEVEVTEKGTTTTTKTGNKGNEKDIIPKVEIHKKNLKSTVVKFIYTIKITNEGEIPGYATEITDYVPEGLKFYAEDNKGWEEKEDGIIVTELLSDTLLKPGESAKIKVTFRWINDEDNLGVKTNIAEISEDDNERGIPDRDSTPGNKKDGEDDIDDADVLLSIKTGMTENIIAYITGATIILLVLAGGVILIKKFVL